MITIKDLQYKLVSSMEKIFPYTKIDELEEYNSYATVKGDVTSFQFVYTKKFIPNQNNSIVDFKLKINSQLKEYVNVRQVDNVPVLFPCYPDRNDNNYISKEVGLYPDILKELDEYIIFTPYRTKSLWIDVTIPIDIEAGNYAIELEFEGDESKVIKSSFNLQVIDLCLKEQQLIHTEWVHYDCLADFYNVAMFSDKHLEIIKNFLQTAVKRGVNTILIPIHTPPLDTKEGTERTTSQLVDISVINGEYYFNFTRFCNFINMCRELGVKYFEMAHLFTQWGAKHAPSIYADVDGKYTRIFGWETEALGKAYTEFLEGYLTELKKVLEDLGIAKNTIFHISDEPNLEQLPFYTKAAAYVKPLLEGYKVVDALSDIEIYRKCENMKPIPSNDHIEPFLTEEIEGLWVYYCNSQCVDVANRFIAMPSVRNRILGVQLYKYDIEGFLHWGFNFYNSKYSLNKVDPYSCTDADCGFPSGNQFLVYPGKNLKPVESIRIMVLQEALNDLRLFRMLEEKTSKDYVMGIIEKDVDPITFSKYPLDNNYLINLRKEVIRELLNHK